jgi:hypothetical protein
LAVDLVGSDKVIKGQYLEESAAKEFLINMLIQGIPILIDVSTKMGDPNTTAHFVVVCGWDPNSDSFIYADPDGYISKDKPYNPGIYQASWSAMWNSWSLNLDGKDGGYGFYLYIK